MCDRVALITGCNGGIGERVVREFKDDGYIVVGTDITDTVKANMDMFIKGDLCDSTTHESITNRIQATYGRLDCIVNVAAVQRCGPIWEMREEEWDRVYNCNVKSVYLFVKYGIDLLKASKGNIVNVGSVHSICTSDKIAAYGSSKAAIVGLTRNLAIELAQFGVRVNCVSPGAIDTDMLRAGLRRGHAGGDELTDNDLIDNLGKQHLMGKVGRTDHISKMILFLADNKRSGFTTGSNVVVDGGATIKLSTE